MTSPTTPIVFKIDPDLKAAFERIAAERDLTVSQMLRAYIREEVESEAKSNKQTDLFKPAPAPKAPKKGKKPANAALGLMAKIKKGSF